MYRGTALGTLQVLVLLAGGVRITGPPLRLGTAHTWPYLRFVRYRCGLKKGKIDTIFVATDL
jgi:hypothetical protein